MTATRTVTFSLNENEFLRAAQVLWAYRAIGSTANHVIGGIVAVIGAALIWRDVPGWAPWVLLLLGGAISQLSLVRDRLWRRYYRKALKYTAPIKVTFDDAGIDVASAEATGLVPWSTFTAHLVTPDYIFLIIDARGFSVIPRAAFADVTQRAAVEDLIGRRLKRLPRRYL
jgi:hypothetical protein